MRTLLMLAVVIAGMSAACKNDGGAPGRAEAYTNLAKIATLLQEVVSRLGGGFPEAPPCVGNPPVNEFSVPRSPDDVAGKRYQPAMDDWSVPWMKFYFALRSPIQALYCYESDGRSFTVHASTDVDGDGTWAHYQRSGEMVEGRPAIGPFVAEREGE
jgi:hypothetical protein